MVDKPTLGLIVGSRGSFPNRLAEEGRRAMLEALAALDIEVICLSPGDRSAGAVETLADAKKCAELFRRHREEIVGLIVSLPNFGDEKAVADALAYADLDVPVLVHAFPDDPETLGRANRRDAFCGKISVCNNLVQRAIPFSLTSLHTESPATSAFRRDVDRFVRICRVAQGLSSARIGAIGARTGPFNTVRFSEKILQEAGISVETLDLSEVLAWIGRLEDGAPEVRENLEKVRSYAPGRVWSDRAVLKMAKLHGVLDRWIRETELNAVALQCWTSIEENLGIAPCAVMSMLSDSLLPAACEVDVMGALSMYALQLASGKPAGLMDWNNNYGDDPDCAVLFHCSNWPKSFFRAMEQGRQDIMAETVGPGNADGACRGLLKKGPVTLARLSTHDADGEIVGYVAEGRVLADEVSTFGGRGAVRVERLQHLLETICINGFEHHVAMSYSQVADVLDEALTTYLDWDIYRHR